MKRKLLLMFVAVIASSFAFGQLIEGFETWPPPGWTIVQGACSPTNDITQNGDQFYSGTHSARFSSYSSCGSGYDEYLITPLLATTTGDQTISFWYRRYSSGTETFKVGWSSTGTDVANDFTWSAEISDASITWQQYSKTDLPVGTKYVAIHYYSNYAYYLYIDDVAGPALGGVLNPASFTAVAASSSEIDLDWTLNANSDNVLVAWSSDGTFGTPVDGSTYSAGNSITGGGTVLYYGSALHYDHQTLPSNTSYYYEAWSYDGSNYSSGLTDDATTDFVFVTQALPFTEDFETNLDVWYLSGTTTPELSATEFHGGSQSLSFNTIISTNSSVTVQLGSGTTPMLSFWYYIDYYYSNDLTVDIKQAGASTWTTVIWQQATTYSTQDTWLEAEVDLSSYNTSGDFQLRFNAENTYSYSNYIVYMDDVSVVEVNCPAPTAQTETTITTSGAQLSWTEVGSATTWNIEWKAGADFTPGNGEEDGTASVTTNPTHSLTGLIANTTYYWYVQADCGSSGGTGTSVWVGESHFTTACATITSFPYDEGFEGTWAGSPSAPACWSQITVAGAGPWESSTTSPHGGSKCAKAPWDGSGGDHLLITPELSFGTTDYQLKFWLKGSSSSGTDLKVQIANDNSSAGNFTTDLAHYVAGTNMPTSWTEYTIDLSAYENTQYIAFRMLDADGYSLYIDDVTVEEIPSCLAPTSLTETNIGINSADLGWTENNTPAATTWDIEYAATPYTFTDIPTVTGTTTNPHSLTGLSINTEYTWQVRSGCGSTWAGPSTFTTSDGIATNPTPADDASGIAVTSKTLDWDDVVGADGYHITVGTTTGGNEIIDNVEITGATNSTYTVPSNWTAATTYYWTVTTDYNTTLTVEGNEWEFLTECGNVTVYPYSEAFEGTVPPTCWTEVRTPASSSGWSSNTGGNTGNCARFNSYSNANGNESELITKTLDLSGLSTARLKFVYKNPTGGDFSVLLSTDGGVTYPNTIWSGLTGQSVWLEKTADITAHIGANVKIAFKGTSNYGNGDAYIYLDDVTVEQIPSTPVFNISPVSKDFGTVNVDEVSAAQTFTISNSGAGTLQITSVSKTGTDTDEFTLTDGNSYPHDLAAGASITVDVAFAPTSDGAKTANLHIEDNLSKTAHDAVLEGDGYVPPQGAICSNPLSLILPAVDVSGNTDGFLDDYSSADISPSSSYLNGDDIVYQFTVADGKLTGSVVTTESWMGVFILDDCPNSTSPPTPVIQKTSGSGTTVTFDENINAGTYYLIISSYPAPQSIDFNINLSLTESPADAVWTGATDSDWGTTGNWDVAAVPGFTTDVTIPVGLTTNYPTLTSAGECNDLTIQSTASGDGSLIESGNLTTSGTVIAQRYISNGQWHGISAPVSSATAQSLYSNTANVYLKYHTELTNIYENVVDLGYNLGDAKGFMMWYAGTTTGETFDITGNLRGSTTVGSDNNMVRTGPNADPNWYGWNFVGNPYTSAIDWDAGTGWTKTNISGTIYLYNNGNWNTWNGTTGTVMTSGHIAMGQGFFVEVNNDGSTLGTLKMTNDVQTHNDVDFLKEGAKVVDELVRLQVSNEIFTDETVIYFDADATDGFDSQFDAHKLFSFDQTRPHIYSTANNKMAINVLPIENTEVLVDVSGVDGEFMTIESTEILGFGDVFMLDNYTGMQTNLSEASYTFMYDEDVSNRFLIFFTTVSTPEISDEFVTIYSFDNNVRVIVPEETQANIVIYNLVGQKLSTTSAHKGVVDIPVYETGYYLVKVMDNNNIVTKKVFIK